MEPPFDSCPTCDGDGGVVAERLDGDGALHLSHSECPDCDGTGRRRIDPPFYTILSIVVSLLALTFGPYLYYVLT